jgi:hypothetical protein
MPVPQQLPQIPVLPARHPDLRKVILQHQLHPIDGVDGVRSRLAKNRQHDSLLPVDQSQIAPIRSRIDHFPYFAKPHRRSIVVGDDEGAILVRREQLVGVIEFVHPRSVRDSSLGPVGVRSVQGIPDSIQTDSKLV